MSKIIVGQFTATGAEINVSLGFSPSFIFGYCVDDPGLFMWSSSDDAAGGHVDGGTPATMTAGITTYAGGDVIATAAATHVDEAGTAVVAGLETGKGFTIGTDANINTSTEVVHYIAICSEAEATADNASYTDEDS